MSLKYLLTSLCILVGLLFLAFPVMASNKNGVSPSAISLPSGPGSIEGLGQSFQPMLNTGTAKYSVKITIPRGVAGHTPEVSLDYESGLGDGPLGIGWKLGPGSIRRQTERGIPRYVDGPNGKDDDYDGQVDEPDEEDRFIGIDGEELVRLADGTYRSRIERNFVRYERLADHWEVRLKNGKTLAFGITHNGRITDATGDKIFKWFLEKSTDRNGNVIEYSYARFTGDDNQTYLKEIRYGPGAPPWTAFYFVYFTYETRPDWRKDYRSGFLVKTTKRLKQIDIGIQGVLPDQCAQGDWNNDGIQDALIRRYVLTYDNTSLASHLVKVTCYGSDGISYLPPLSFSYSTFNPPQSISAHAALITSNNAPPTVMDSSLVELVDMNRDGLPDILKTDLNDGNHTCYYNLGTESQGSSRWIKWDDGHVVNSADGLASKLHLSNDGVCLADIDGNGISDLVETPFSNEVYYFLNKGDGSWGERKQMSIQDTAPPAPFANSDVVTVDLNFDKRMDVVKSTDGGYSIWFNLEEGKYTREVHTEGASMGGQGVRFSQTGVQLADLNGDRLIDVARIRPSSVTYCASMGHGHFDTAVTIPIPDAVLTDGTNGQVARARLKDINGDGLSDLVVERAETGELWYWVNQGTDSFSSKHVITDMPTQFGPNMVTRWADINGNGTTDLIYADSTVASRIVAVDIGELAGGSAHPNLLTGIDNGLGLYTDITYTSSTEFYLQAREDGNPWSSTIPFPVSVISRVKVTTGLDLDGIPGNDEYVKTYSYRDGYYEDREKAFRGFEQVTVKELGDSTAPTRVTTHSFFTGGPDGVDNDGDSLVDEVSGLWHREEDALKGKVKSIAVSAENGTLFSDIRNDWLVKDLAIGVDNTEVRFAYNQESKKVIYEGTQTPETIRTTFVYDSFGNVTEERKYGALSITGDESFTFTEYINDTNLWIVGLPSHQYVTDGGLNKISETFNYYDGPDYTGLALGHVSKGNLVRKEGWVEGSTYVNLVRRAYDVYGNIVGIRDPNGNQRSVTYDSTMHEFPVEETIEVGGGNPDLTITAAYNLGLGVIVSTTDFNGNQSTYGYDSHGRITSIVRPGDSPALPTMTFAYTMSDPRNGIIYSYDASGTLNVTTGAPPAPSSVIVRKRETSGQGGTFDTFRYVDGLGRKLAEVEEAESGFVTKDAVLFNSMGKVRYRFMPYSAATSEYSPPPTNLAAREIYYDASGRESLRINPPDANNLVTSQTIAYLPLSRTVTDENGKPKTFFYDGHNRLIKIHEQNLGDTYVTTYAYDALGNLLRITDAQGNVKTLEYDGLSRRTAVRDPDRGSIEYTYDDAGNVVRTIDNKGQVITYTYDGANRLLTEDYQDSALISPDVAYHYDIPSPDYPDAENTKGQLAWVKDLSGGSFFSYDARGNTLWAVKRITDNGHPRDYPSTSTYDAMNRLMSITFPDGDTINYTYNNRSLLESIPGVVNSIDYHNAGMRSSITYANGIKTTYFYDPRLRMISLLTDLVTPSGTPLQNLSYSFDGRNNVTSITDNRSQVSGTPQDATQTFQYDDLYRMIQAQGPGYGTISFQYDKIGNMTFKASPSAPDPQHVDNPLINLGAMTVGGIGGTANRSVRMPGDPPGPHAVTGTESGLTFAYDDNGNMTHSTGDAYEWDFRDRLVQTKTDHGVTSYVYDYTGRRVIKKTELYGSETTVYYVNKGYEIRNGKPVKYVFDAKSRVARIEGRLFAGSQASSQILNLRSGWNYFSLEVEPDDPAITTVLAPLAGKFTGVWSFDTGSGEYVGYVPSKSINDLTEIHAQHGYMIFMETPAMVTVSGTMTTNSVSLQVGWNLVAYPSDYQIPLPEALQSIDGKYEEVWAFDSITQKWQSFIPGQPSLLNDLKVMEPGKAYWIKMTQTGQIFFQQQSPQVYFFHADHLGSSNVITDKTGAVVERAEFYPFGLLRYDQAIQFESAYRFTGKERDQESGLDYFGARYFSPVTGRFVSVDPLQAKPGNPQDLNVYSYVKNNPMAFIDPRGLSSESLGPDLLDGDQNNKGSEDKGSSMDQWKEDLVKTLLAIGLNALETAVKDSGAKKYIQWAVGGIGIVEMGIEAIESGDWEKILEFSLGAGETVVGVTTGHKLALVEMYQYGKGMYEMGKTAYEYVSSDVGGTAKYAAIMGGKEVLEKGPEGAFNSLLRKVKPPQIWQPNAAGTMPMWEKAKGKGMEFLNPYVEETVGYIPLLNEEEKSMVEGSTRRMLY